MRASASHAFLIRICYRVCTFTIIATGVLPRPLAAQTPAPASVVDPILSPYRNLEKSQQILDMITRWMILEQNYQLMDAGEWTWQSQTLPGMQAARYFFQDLGQSAYRTH